MEIAALTRSKIHSNYAVFSPDGFTDSHLPGWTNCTVNVIISEKLGAGFCQTLITFNKRGRISGQTIASQIFFYVVKGQCTAAVDDKQKVMTSGHFVYVPIGHDYHLDLPEEGTQVISFHKEYARIDGHEIPAAIFGDSAKMDGIPFSGDEAVHLKTLLPGDSGFDMAINILRFAPGAHLPVVETHLMEHGLLMLQGKGIYMLDQQWYPVATGDMIWMGSYCPQWFVAIGKEDAVYIYYKDINRHPVRI